MWADGQRDLPEERDTEPGRGADGEWSLAGQTLGRGEGACLFYKSPLPKPFVLGVNSERRGSSGNTGCIHYLWVHVTVPKGSSSGLGCPGRPTRPEGPREGGTGCICGQLGFSTEVSLRLENNFGFY